MPSITENKKFSEREFSTYGAGGEPLGEPPAPPPGVGAASRGLSEELVEGALEQARLRTAIREMPEQERRRLAEAVLDELSEEHSCRRRSTSGCLTGCSGRCFRASAQSGRSSGGTACWASCRPPGRASALRGALRASGLPGRARPPRRRWELAQWRHAEDAFDRPRPGADRRPPRPQEPL